MGMGAVAGATLGAGALSAGVSLIGGSKAASAAKDAANLQHEQYLQTRADLSPFTQAGADVLPGLNALATSGLTGGGPDYVGMAGAMFPGGLPGSGGPGTPGGGMSQAELEATPGYQFTRDQGLKAVQSAAAARGLGMSGASLKGAATYATGLANSTYKTQFDVANQKFQDVLAMNTGQIAQLGGQYQRLQGTAALGESAAAGLGQQGTAAASAAGNYLNAAGGDQANALSNATNAIAGSVNNYLGYQARQNALNPQTPTSGYGNAAVGTPGISASGNPVMTGFIGNENIGSPGAYVPPV